MDFDILERHVNITTKCLQFPTDPIENISTILIKQRCLKAANHLIQVKLSFSDVIIALDKFVQFREMILKLIENKGHLDRPINIINEKLENSCKIKTQKAIFHSV